MSEEVNPSDPRRISTEDATLALNDANGWTAKKKSFRSCFEVEGQGEFALDGVFHTGDGRWILRTRAVINGLPGGEPIYFETDAFGGLDSAYWIGAVNGVRAARLLRTDKDRARRIAKGKVARRPRGRPPNPKIREQIALARALNLSSEEAAQRFGGQPGTWRVRFCRFRQAPSDSAT